MAGHFIHMFVVVFDVWQPCCTLGTSSVSWLRATTGSSMIDNCLFFYSRILLLFYSGGGMAKMDCIQNWKGSYGIISKEQCINLLLWLESHEGISQGSSHILSVSSCAPVGCMDDKRTMNRWRRTCGDDLVPNSSLHHPVVPAHFNKQLFFPVTCFRNVRGASRPPTTLYAGVRRLGKDRLQSF